MNLEQLSLTAGGVLTVSVGLFHLAFWRLFDWKDELPRLQPVNRGVLQVLNIQITVMAFVLGFVSLRYPAELSSTPLGQALVWGIAVFWLVRALNQPLFWGMSSRVSMAFTAVWAIIALTYLIPAVL
ncbi:MAG: hypothetical protein SFU83_14190 [Meiothermus sp.]|nr:hypothetical protein [Meiothermus sp.]